ncbi:MAG: DJ-1/PfpI family protein [Candidatus Brockarchaeota archaeon]|nr:DJ-1/PfpI family protein [Candidatus Brockarchaeota archaeon]
MFKKTFLLLMALLLVIVITGGGVYYWFAMRPGPLPIVRGAKVLVLVADRYNHVEYSYVVDALIRQGAEVTVASFEVKTVTSYDGGTVNSQVTFEDVEVEEFHAIYIPGGYAPEDLAKSELVLNIVRGARTKGLVIAAICHGPLVLAKADVIKDVRVTGYSAILNDLKEAGGIVVNDPSVRAGLIITGVDPKALPSFTKLFLEALEERIK